MTEEFDLNEQAKLFDQLSDEKRLRILRHAVEGPISAPGLAEKRRIQY